MKTTKISATARIAALAAEDDALNDGGTHEQPAFNQLIQKTAKLAKELCPPTTITVHVPPWCVEHARHAAATVGATLEQLYTFLLAGCWGEDVFDEGVQNLLRDMKSQLEDEANGAVERKARPSRQCLVARLSQIEAHVNVNCAPGQPDHRQRLAKGMREVVALAGDVIDPTTFTLRLPKHCEAHARKVAAECGVTLEQALSVLASSPWSPLDDREHVTAVLNDIEQELMRKDWPQAVI